jgi:RNA polymerase sigma-70 factor (sigma-E family)
MNAAVEVRDARPLHAVRQPSARSCRNADSTRSTSLNTGQQGATYGIGRRASSADNSTTLSLRAVVKGSAPREAGVRGLGGNATEVPGGAGEGRRDGRCDTAAAARPAVGVPGGASGEPAPGAEEDFTAYVRERRASLYATAYHLTGDRYEAEDLLQSALFSTYRAWGRITDKAAVGGYMRRTMTNLHISAWRRRKVNEYPTEEMPESASAADAMGGTELRAVLWQALAKLPETQRTMLVLRYYEGRTDPEIAGILDISVGTVKSSIWRALRRLREDESLSQGGDLETAFGELVA